MPKYNTNDLVPEVSFLQMGYRKDRHGNWIKKLTYGKFQVIAAIHEGAAWWQFEAHLVDTFNISFYDGMTAGRTLLQEEQRKLLGL